jgi:ribonuclease P protein component
MRLPSGSRVRLHGEVRRVLERGRTSASGPVVVYAYGRGDPLPPRFALVVGRRWGGAVERNLVRRRLREAFRIERAGLPAGFDFALTPRAPVGAAVFEHVRRALAAAARSAARKFGSEGPKPPSVGAKRK